MKQERLQGESGCSKERNKILQNYKIVIAYDGSRYKGWQSQKNVDATIQGKLNHVFSTLENRCVEVQGAGRTDAGVHATGQVANVKLDKGWTPEEIMEYANHYLPEDIGIVEIEKAPAKFHARLSAIRKTYCYRIFNSSASNVFERKWMCKIAEPLDLEAMRQGAVILEGRHDFSAFCFRASKKKSAVRTIERIEVKRKGREVDIIITGDGFLHHMVRIIAGTLVEVGLGKRQFQEMEELLKRGVRDQAGVTMPAQGLVLLSVEYQQGQQQGE